MESVYKLSNIWITPEYLESLRLCMNYGYVSAKDIISCADKIIMSSENTDGIVLDLSLAHNKEAREIDYIINIYTGDKKSTYSARILLSMLYCQWIANELSTKEISYRLYKYSFDLTLTELERKLFYPFDNRYHIAESGISGNVADVNIDLNNLLVIYKEYSLNNYPEWQKIHTIVDKELFALSNITQ